MNCEIYDEENRLVFLEFNCSHPDCLVLIGGLGDGLLTIGYERELALAAKSSLCSLVQPLLCTSYRAYGLFSIEKDVQNLRLLIGHLVHKRKKARICLLGHSTGCQSIVHLMRSYTAEPPPPALSALILQAPTSDRLYFLDKRGLEKWRRFVETARSLSSQDLMPPAAESGTPITAQRFLSLYSADGAEDVFSADLPLARWRENLASLTLPTLVVFGGADETVPAEYRSAVATRRLFEDANAQAKTLLLENASHNVQDKDSKSRFFSAVFTFFRR